MNIEAVYWHCVALSHKRTAFPAFRFQTKRYAHVRSWCDCCDDEIMDLFWYGPHVNNIEEDNLIVLPFHRGSISVGHFTALIFDGFRSETVLFLAVCPVMIQRQSRGRLDQGSKGLHFKRTGGSRSACLSKAREQTSVDRCRLEWGMAAVHIRWPSS